MFGVIPVLDLKTDLKIKRQCYDSDHFVSLLNVLIASALQHRSWDDLIDSITDRTVSQFRMEALNQFSRKWNKSKMNDMVQCNDTDSIFSKLFNAPQFILENANGVLSTEQIEKQTFEELHCYRIPTGNRNGDGDHCHKLQEYPHWIHVESFDNIQAVSDEARIRVGSRLQSVCRHLRDQRQSVGIGLSILYSVNFIDSYHSPWCYVLKFKASNPNQAKVPSTVCPEPSSVINRFETGSKAVECIWEMFFVFFCKVQKL